MTVLVCYFFGYWCIREAVDVAFFVGAGVVLIGFQISQSAGSENTMSYLSTRYTGEGRKIYEQKLKQTA